IFRSVILGHPFPFLLLPFRFPSRLLPLVCPVAVFPLLLLRFPVGSVPSSLGSRRPLAPSVGLSPVEPVPWSHRRPPFAQLSPPGLRGRRSGQAPGSSGEYRFAT